MPYKVVIVGAGIGGLATAIALADKGHKVMILEATELLRVTGDTIMLNPNAIRGLDQLGIYEDFLTICREHPWHRSIYRYTGEKVVTLPADAYVERYGYPYGNQCHMFAYS
jgi:3-hydroxybenzoate 6-monooxygenase